MVIITEDNKVLVAYEFALQIDKPKNELESKTYTLKANFLGECFTIFSMQDNQADSNNDLRMTYGKDPLDQSLEKVSEECLFDSIVSEVVRKLKNSENSIDIHEIILKCTQQKGKRGYAYKIHNLENNTVGYFLTANIDDFKDELSEFNKDSANKVLLTQVRSDIHKNDLKKFQDEFLYNVASR